MVLALGLAVLVPTAQGAALPDRDVKGAAVEAAAAKKKAKKCRKGYERKRVRGKVRCVKKKRKAAAPKPAPAPTRTTDPAKVKQALAGSLWFWTRFDQAGTGGTTDRTHVNLCADGTFRLRRSSTTEDGQGSSFTVIIEDLSSNWGVTTGSYDSATGDVEAVVTTTSEARRVRTASGPEFSQPNEALQFRLARRAGNAFLEEQPASLLNEPPFCSFE